MKARRRALKMIHADPSLTNQTDYEPVLHCTVRAGNAEVIKALIQAGANINATGDSRDESPLHFAVQAGNLEIVRLILSYSPDLSVTDYSGITPLLKAARSGALEVANELIQNGAQLDFHSAVALGQAEVVRKMLKRDPSVIRSVRHVNDLLPDAVYSDSLDTVAALLECPEIDIHAFGLSGDPPLTAAVSCNGNDPANARLLLSKGADPRHPDKRGNTALERAYSVGVSHWLVAE